MIFEGNLETLQFLKRAGWANATVTPLVQDASSRQYYRLTGNKKTAILMNAPAKAETAICPPHADEREREELGYTAVARLAGNECRAFICIANELSTRGFASPKILACAPQDGLVLLEDLGEQLFAKVLVKAPELEEKYYQATVKTLSALARSTFGQNFTYQEHQWPVLDYDMAALLTEAELLVQWYLPFKGVQIDPQTQDQLQQAWAKVLTPVLDEPTVLVLRDFHAENLIMLDEPQEEVGLLDFQDAVFGHPAYDLVSLLQDARRDVSPALEQQMITQFTHDAKITNSADFDSAYRVLGAQRAAKILGIFVRLAERDGKQKYLSLLPRVEQHFSNNLAHLELQPIAKILLPLLAERADQ